MKVSQISIILFILLLSLTTRAQKSEREALYHFKAKNYIVALKLFQKLYEKDTTNVDLTYKLGICYVSCNKNPAEALKYFLKVEPEFKSDPEFLFYLGQAYLYNYDFINAKTTFQNCINLSEKEELLQDDAELWLQMTQTAERMKKNPLDVSFINMGKYINSELDELTPFITPDGEMLLYTSNQKYDSKFQFYTYDVYYSYDENGVFKKGKTLSSVNSLDDEYMAGISLSNERIFVQLQGYEGYQDLISSDRKAKSFQNKVAMKSNVNSKYAEFGACETINSDTLFFSSGRDGGYGGMDIFYSLKLPTGEWGEARNLGEKINTPYDEDFPVLSKYGTKLYFTSNRPESMGGYDIFESKINGNREFSTPKNIGYPLNDVFDNKTIAYSDNERYAYVSAIKSDSYGFTDLYQVVFNQEDPSAKIFILNFKLLEGENTIPFAETDTTLIIKAFQKNSVVFGEYAYQAKNSQSTMALPPGIYTIEVSGIKTEKTSLNISVDDSPSGEKIEKKEIVLKQKK